mmetsp:Transcript_1245/g.2958  ORF Transcript_1245/g.2958 Transcript_1245/m.2958 type:complete len:623 (-) Transcript_1245:86-1954(-)
MAEAVNIQTVPWFGTKSTTTREVTLKILGSDETLTLPLQVTTKVVEVRHMLAGKLACDWESFTFIQSGVGGKTRTLRDEEEIRTHTLIKGAKSFQREKMRWGHPHAIIGAGHGGLRAALSFLKEGLTDFMVFDRHHIVGGTAWVVDGNKTSKLQTEFAVYHLQYDPSYPAPTNYRTQPTCQELLDHFASVAEEYGIMPHVVLNSSVTDIDVVKEPNDPSGFTQTYHLCIEECAGGGEEHILECSSVAMFPGGLIRPKRANYKGEDIFEGQIGYGMANEFDYSIVENSAVAIIGFGAFATENVRTCVEKGANKISIVCRRKNMAMPRVVSWLTNQSMFPVPGKTCLEVMMPMYELAGDDPWTYYAVITTEKRTTATLRQASRFGIGDVFFLARYFGKCDVIVGTVKRVKRDGIQLESGDMLDVQHVIKVLGYLGDSTTDKVMGAKKMEGFHVNGDFRRLIWAENPGIDAGKFGGTSFSPGIIAIAEMHSWFLNYPMDSFMILGTGMLPTKKQDPEAERPTYVWDPRSGGTISMLYSGVPAIGELAANYGQFNRDRQLEMHPVDVFVEECAEEWYMYGEMLKKGTGKEIPEYPYSVEYVREVCAQQDKEGEEDQARQAARMMGN